MIARLAFDCTLDSAPSPDAGDPRVSPARTHCCLTRDTRVGAEREGWDNDVPLVPNGGASASRSHRFANGAV